MLLLSINILSVLALLPFSNETIYAGMLSNIFHILILHFGLMIHYRKIQQEYDHTLEQSRITLQQIELEKKYNEEQKQLLAMLTHEIRTPIAVIDAAIESLQILDGKGGEISLIFAFYSDPNNKFSMLSFRMNPLKSK